MSELKLQPPKILDFPTRRLVRRSYRYRTSETHDDAVFSQNNHSFEEWWTHRAAKDRDAGGIDQQACFDSFRGRNGTQTCIARIVVPIRQRGE